MFLNLLVGGLMLGSIYALVALGFSLIYSASGLMTFMQGEFFMLGAFMIYTFFIMCNLPFIIAFLITMVCCFFFGMFTEKMVIGPLLNRGSKGIHIVLATIALSIFLQNIAMLVWGTKVFHVPAVFGDNPVNIGGISLVPQNIWIVALSILSMLILHLFMTNSKLGTSMRAAAQDKIAASILGINVPLTRGLTWAFASVMAGIGGVLLAPIYGVYATMGALISLKGFAAAVIGGYGNMYGAMLGGLILGLVETFASGYISSDAKDIILFVVLLGVLFYLPQGILKGKMIAE
jgi:branched-chain amino acid transport system permease protein